MDDWSPRHPLQAPDDGSNAARTIYLFPAAGSGMNRWTAGFALAALLLLAAPFALWPHYGQTPYMLEVGPAESADHGEVVTYEDLPPDARAPFEDALDGESVTLYEEADEELVATFQRYQYVEYGGDLYYASLPHGDGAWLFVIPIRWGMFLAGAGLGITAAVRFRRERRADAD